ncbi:hypothetical protein K1T71_007824 [Dendrolimus kikuchii]|uniref:Uncharacterized protein n=1 Tax=Dendrolimus kikuchii TaxID=765133 RepID=A0ACC1CYU0_9NEOP|nr:hypothetical protein K1T71_007824 [Dendrolimus kikuchii]
MPTMHSTDATTVRGASGQCIISIANFDKRSTLDAIRKYKRTICKSLWLTQRYLFTWLVRFVL